MERNLSPIAHITPAYSRWTSLVQIVEQTKELTRKTQFGETKYKRVTLTDNEGTKAVAIIRGSDIQYFERLLSPYKRYFISNAIINSSSDTEKDPSYPYSWVITNKTIVEPYLEAIPTTFNCHFNLTSFKDLFRFADTTDLQNIQAIAIAALPTKEKRNSSSNFKEFVIVNKEKKLMVMTLWKEFADVEGSLLTEQITNVPVILAMRMKVTIFNGLQLSTWMPSTSSINPPMKNMADLNHWYHANKEELHELLKRGEHRNIRSLLPPPPEDSINTISERIHLKQKNARAIWIKATATLTPGKTKYYYNACAHCDKSLDAENYANFQCTSCNMKTKTVTRNYLYHVFRQ